MAEETKQRRDAADEELSDFPPGPAWAVGADREHHGPSGMGPGEDQPGFGQEVDEEDASGVTGGFVLSQAEADAGAAEGEPAPASPPG